MAKRPAHSVPSVPGLQYWFFTAAGAEWNDPFPSLETMQELASRHGMLLQHYNSEDDGIDDVGCGHVALSREDEAILLRERYHEWHLLSADLKVLATLSIDAGEVLAE